METPRQWDKIQVPMGRVASFIRQLTHDVRNGLSGIDLEAAFIAEISTDPEVSEEIRKLREMVNSSANMLRELSQHFQPVTLHEIPWRARVFLKELKSRIGAAFPEEKNINFEWVLSSETGSIFIDLEQMIAAFLHGVRNAVQFRRDEEPIKIIATMLGDGSFVLDILEHKPEINPEFPVELWGTKPLSSTRSGGYGLGLWKMQEIVLAHGGEVERRSRDGMLRTRITLPEYHDEARPV